MDEEPLRLRDDPAVDELLREDLARAAEVSPPIDPSAGLARLKGTLAGGGTFGSGAVPWIAGGLAVLAIGAATWLATRDAGEPIAPAPAVVAANDESEPALPVVVPELVVEPAPPPESAPSGDADDAPPEPAARVERASSRPSPRRSPSDPLREEMALVARARAALAREPARALALADEGARRFPRGIFGEEREAIAVLASSALGRTQQARSRGERFLRAHPSGPFSERVRRAIEAP